MFLFKFNLVTPLTGTVVRLSVCSADTDLFNDLFPVAIAASDESVSHVHPLVRLKHTEDKTHDVTQG